MAKILILNWRDPQSQLEGGAERFTKKYAEYWAKQGHQVYWLTNFFPGSSKEETISGVKYLRVRPVLDGTLSRYILCYPVFLLQAIVRAAQLIRQKKIDIVIDEIHGFPFFTPLFSQTRNILLVCEVAGPIWHKMFPWPISSFGSLCERLIYSLYKQTEILAISENTKRNVLQILPKANVSIIPLGVEPPKNLANLKKLKKHAHPSAVFLARLVRMKGIETALQATAEIVCQLPDFKLYVIGKADDDYQMHLTSMVKKLGISRNVNFLGFVSESQKYKTLRKAHFLLHPSYKEGFGLTVIEAGLVGTPAIIRAGSSLDELVVNKKSGFHFENDSEIPELVISSLENKTYQRLVKNALQVAQKRTWTNTLKNSITVL